MRDGKAHSGQVTGGFRNWFSVGFSHGAFRVAFHFHLKARDAWTNTSNATLWLLAAWQTPVSPFPGAA